MTPWILTEPFMIALLILYVVIIVYAALFAPICYEGHDYILCKRNTTLNNTMTDQGCR